MTYNPRGLTSEQVLESRRLHGANVLTPPRHISLWRLYIEKFDDPMIRILLVAALVSLAMSLVTGDYLETLGIILAVFFATTVGFYFEVDANRRFDLLSQFSEEQPVKAVRDGRVCQVMRSEVVVGDVLLVETGDEVSADGRLAESIGLEVDESSLTGEPLTEKHVVAHDAHGSEGTPTADSAAGAYPPDMLLRSSMVMSGTGRMVVTAVGDATEIGQVARDAATPTTVKTPLSLQLDRLAKLISKAGTAVSVLAFVAFLLHDVLTSPLWHTDDYMGMANAVLRYFMMAVTLIVMAVPEGLPMAVTLALALNMRRMLKSNILVRKLHACETMGAVTVICTDKTGTLTQNRMQVRDMLSCDYSLLARAIALNTTAELSPDGQPIGNPTEAALLGWLRDQGTDYRQVRSETAVDWREPFTTERKMMVSQAGGWIFVKGAPEVVLSLCEPSDDNYDDVRQMLSDYQHKAMRTLAFAGVPVAVGQSSTSHKLPPLQFIGICAISDPLRPEVPQAVADCHRAGIEVKVLTGDTMVTAAEIARQAGIVEDSANAMPSVHGTTLTGQQFEALDGPEALEVVDTLKVMSRARPADKQRLVRLLQDRDEVVAVTGDGTNDAPALSRAHVGLSLGSGTSVAKQASDITLVDDSFLSIVKAVMWGRSLYKNIQRFIYFQLVVNVTALLLVLAGSVMGTELPLTVTQILWVNLIMDTFAAMALASLPPSREVMGDKPRQPSDFIISHPMGLAIVVTGVAFFVAMTIYLYIIEHSGHGISVAELTAFFTTFVMLQWWNLLNARALGSTHSAFRHLLRCRGMLLVMAMVLAGQWLIVTFGGRMFRTEPMDWATWLTIAAATSPVAVAGELWRALLRARQARRQAS